MTGTVITDLRRRGAVDPTRVLTGPLRAVGLQWLDPGRSVEVAAEGVERALYITAGSGTATVPEQDGTGASTVADSGLPLVEGTALTLPLGARTVLRAGTAGLEYFHAVLAVTGRPGGATAHPTAERPGTDCPATDCPATDRPLADRPGTEQPGTEHPSADPPAPRRPPTGRPSTDHPFTDRPSANGRAAETPDRPETPPSPKGGEAR
ncbi:hypothetical protein ACIQ9P_19005 [Kitasatospora sp. NPDC094019]|uniref:hypothetical protein n=1 Tax=Kitasatospora sp. NPDC094019 TaxID=3364091 RepID=UPI0038108695